MAVGRSVALTAVLSGSGLHCTKLTPPDLMAIHSVDLSRYTGTWYELARLPVWFQRHCVDSKSTYTMLGEGRIGMKNECLTASGKIETMEGVARAVDSSGAKLEVVFENWFSRLFGSSRQGNYWILYLDEDYRTAIVGTPDHRYLWILSRSPYVDDSTYQGLVHRAQGLGYSVGQLIRDQRSAVP